MPELRNGSVRLWYAERGDPEGPPTILLHGLFFSRRLFERLARRLPEQRMLLLDLRGHGRSSRPIEPSSYSWELMGRDVLALMDLLDLPRATVGGLSLGANVALAVASLAPQRLSGAIIEMPVLEGGRPAAERVFGAVATALQGAGWLMRPATRASAPLRRTRYPELGSFADLLSLEPTAAAAMLRGLMDEHEVVRKGPQALAREAVPTLVIGHRHDPIHPLDDARDIISTVPGSRLHVMATQADLRFRIGHYAEIIGDFLRTLPDGGERGRRSS
ncbi:MAG TPA: alpha/beta fold hydrolase [Acidimicrobiales bacterium]|nr:alpha/beta fold hydrolase [Acidimicrobiales bacterium]